MSDRTPYRLSHSASGYGLRYDANYAVGYYAALHRAIEAPALERIFRELSQSHKSLLDFACGTGRITMIASAYFDRVVGVDVSEAMLEQARMQSGVTFLRQDLTSEALDEHFGVITAFRFFLNAEEELRLEALRTIRAHLAADGRLICNIHMNRYSFTGLIYELYARLFGTVKHKTLSRDQFEQTLTAAGFEIEEVIWYGLLPRPGRLFSRLLNGCVGPIERTLATLGLNGRFCQCFIVVARPSETTR